MRSSRRARTPKSSKRRSSKRRAARRARVPKAPKARRRSSSRSTSRRSTSRRRARAPRASKSRSTSRRSSRRARTPKGPRRRSSRRSTSRRRSSRKRVARRAKKAKKPKIVVGSMRRVWSGTADRTKGGLTKKDLTENKHGKIVSKKQSAQAKKKYKANGLSKWTEAVMKARAELGVTGFMAVKKGTPLYKLAKSYYE